MADSEHQKIYCGKSYDHDFNQFIDFSLDFINNSLTNWWSLDKATMRKGKDLIFPAGFSVKKDQKVYPQEISPIYRYNLTQLNIKMNEMQFVEGPVGLEPTPPCLKGRCSNRLSYGPTSLQGHFNTLYYRYFGPKVNLYLVFAVFGVAGFRTL